MFKKNSLRCLAVCVCFMISVPPHSFGEAADDQSEPETFTLTRRAIPLHETVGSITTISGEQIEREQKRSVLSVVKDVPSVDTSQTGGPGGSSSVFIRGASSEHTLVLYDGVPLTDPIDGAGAYDFAHLLADNIERVEVTRGPQSVLYGSNALGGIIQIFSKRGSGPTRASFSVEGGSHRTALGRASASGGNEKADFLIGLSALGTEGISAASKNFGNTEKDSYQNNTGLARVGIRPRSNLDLSLMVHAFDADSALDNSNGAGGDDPNHQQTTKELVGNQKTKLTLFDGVWDQTLDLSASRHERTVKNGVDADHPLDTLDNEFTGRRKKIGWQNDLYLHKMTTLTLGAEYQDERGDSVYQSEGMFGPFTSIFDEQTTRIRSYYAQDTFKPLRDWRLVAGARHDYHDRFGSHNTYRFGSSYSLRGSGTRLSGTYGTGFKSPTIFQLFSSFGDTMLMPEESVGWDAGFDQSLPGNRVSFGATYFRNDFENLIDFDSNTSKYTNISAATTRGVETFAAVRGWHDSTLRVSYTGMRTQDDRTGLDLLRRANDKASATLDAPITGRASATLSVLYVGPRQDLDFTTFPATRVTLGSYTLTTVGASYRVGEFLEFFGRIENLFKEAYEQVLGYGTPGRTAFIGAKVNL